MIENDKSECLALLNIDSLKKNLLFIKSLASDCEIIAILKANAYGHSANLIAPCLEKLGINKFGVVTVQEAIQLRDVGIKGDILLFSGFSYQNQAQVLLDYNLTPVVSSLEEILFLAGFLAQNKLCPQLNIHLDFDTGMSRLGILINDNPKKALKAIVDTIKLNNNLNLTGICTHLSCAENEDLIYSNYQINIFNNVIDYLYKFDLVPPLIHISNTGSVLNGLAYGNAKTKELANKSKFAIRPGIGLLGIDPTNKNSPLFPVLSLYAPIVARKSLPKNTYVGYGGSYKTQMETQIAIIRIGYADGLKRALSNKGFVLLKGIKCPLIGQISMDFAAIDVTTVTSKFGAKSCNIGKNVTIIGNDLQSNISVKDIALYCNTIPWEIFTSLSDRIKRLIVTDNTISGSP
jgi:alanine racemase